MARSAVEDAMKLTNSDIDHTYQLLPACIDELTEELIVEGNKQHRPGLAQ